MSDRFMIRQGDVMVFAIDALPDNLKPVPRDYSAVGPTPLPQGRVVLAYGEVTGHAHAIADPDVMLLEGEGLNARFLQVLNDGGATLAHEEHSAIFLPAGTYRVVRQREHDLASGEVRLVAD